MILWLYKIDANRRGSKRHMDVLSKNEFEIMSLFWSENRPLSRSEIITLSPQKGWKERSIHILLNSLLEKAPFR